jgi:DNA-binding transcriptional ArsR family regulator
MLRFRFDPDDLLHVRFALHPLGELLWSAAALADPSAGSIHLPWMRRARERLGDLDWQLLAQLGVSGAHGYGVDFLAPPPSTPLPDLDAELARVAATDPAQVRHELELRWPDGELPAAVRPLQRRPARGLQTLARMMRAYWERALAPEWPAIRACAEADIARRTRHLAERGVGAVFHDLHHEVSWQAGELQFARRIEATVQLGGRGLLLIPAVFTWPRTFCLFDEPWQPTVLYPPHGVGTLWAPQAPAAGSAAALAPLLGARRAGILAALDAPASTTELARRLELPASSVSEHLAVLRAAGLVHPGRDRRHVRYARTAAGDALLAAPMTR